MERRLNKLTKKLRLKDFKLNSLLEVTTAINDNYSVDKLLGIYKFILRDQLGVSKLVLFEKGLEWKCLLSYGVEEEETQVDIADNLLKIREIKVIESAGQQHLGSFDVVIPVYHKDQPLAFLLIGDLDEEELRVSPSIKHMPFIQTLTNIIVVAIENKRLAKDHIAQERAKKELEVAAEMQNMLFPQILPSNHLMDVAASYLPHQQVGGDYYDYIPVGNNEFVFCMADVSGKGVSAALLMANFQANLRATLQYTDLSLEDLVRELNSKVMHSANGEKFITFFIAKYNTETKRFVYVNAGHNHPIVSNGKDYVLLKKGTTGLGMFEELPFIQSEEVEIDPHNTLVLYTDGIIEIENDRGEALEIEGLVRAVHTNFAQNMTTMNNSILSYVNQFKGNQPYIDDTALLSCRFF